MNIQLRSGDQLVYSAWYGAESGGHPIGIDLKFSDGTYMRDEKFVDHHKVDAHPGTRDVFTAGEWHDFNIDLSKKSNNAVVEVLVAYDNGLCQKDGDFKAYFDLISIHHTRS